MTTNANAMNYELRGWCSELLNNVLNICGASFRLASDSVDKRAEPIRRECSFEGALIAGIPRDTSMKALSANG